MAKTSDPVALNDWQAVGNIDEIKSGKRRNTRLLGQDIIVEMDGDRPRMFEANADGGPGQEHPAQIMYGHIWTTLGTPAKPPLDMPEFLEDGRRFIACGVVTVRASALRIVENFLDMSHFPYVHTGVLGEEPITEVTDYKSEIRQPDDEIWATDCNFFQPQAAMSADDGQISEYMYRVTSPFVTVLYKTCPVVDGAWDLVGIFVQPREEGVCDVHTFMLVFDDTSTYADLLHFQQKIFLQDRSILENQQPTGLPLSPKDEAAIRADGSSMLYRRWLRQKGLTFGTYQSDGAARAA
ncbi:MAG: aromatic ring-hydroxylating dioxygenase subunit alpha [Alphaproteobacteria bacterium]|jgi:phenylpropionate dioxygenase-like ring-hydroxylating dioxygenase large terminal subunit|nr:aromatic ring-hydroxylating dioxygenase subunit alpha [Alphaproteobacteria bacterium]